MMSDNYAIFPTFWGGVKRAFSPKGLLFAFCGGALLAVAVPEAFNGTRRIQANESSTIGLLRDVCGAEVAYASAHLAYASTFDALTSGEPPFLEGDWSKPRNGYLFTLGGDQDNFVCVAMPAKPGITGNRGFYVDATGVISFAEPCFDEAGEPGR